MSCELHIALSTERMAFVGDLVGFHLLSGCEQARAVLLGTLKHARGRPHSRGEFNRTINFLFGHCQVVKLGGYVKSL